MSQPVPPGTRPVPRGPLNPVLMLKFCHSEFPFSGSRRLHGVDRAYDPRDHLLLAGYHAGQKMGVCVCLRLTPKARSMISRLAAYYKKLRAFADYVGKHEQQQVIFPLGLQMVHESIEPLPKRREIGMVDVDLAYPNFELADRNSLKSSKKTSLSVLPSIEVPALNMAFTNSSMSIPAISQAAKLPRLLR